jgi:hypothetical protein
MLITGHVCVCDHISVVRQPFAAEPSALERNSISFFSESRERMAYNNAAFICMAAEKLKENTAGACKRVGVIYREAARLNT